MDVLATYPPDTHYYNRTLEELSVVQLIQKPTQLLPTPTALDHIITNIDPAPATQLATTCQFLLRRRLAGSAEMAGQAHRPKLASGILGHY